MGQKPSRSWQKRTPTAIFAVTKKEDPPGTASIEESVRLWITLLIACTLGSAGCAPTHTHLAGFLKPVTPRAIVADHSHKDSVTFLVFGDSGTGGNAQWKVASGMWQVCAPDGQRNGCDFAIVLGDNIYRNGVSGSNDVNFQKKFEEPYSHFQRFDFWLVPGNHDWRRERSVQEEINYTGMSDRWRMPFNHYSIPKLPKWLHMYGLDTTVIYDAEYEEKTPAAFGSKRAARLENARIQLETVQSAFRNTTGWKLLFGHHPVYSSGQHGKKDGPGVIPAMKSAIVDELICRGGLNIDVYFAGHEHHQEHLEGSSGCDGGFHQVVQGAGGKRRNSRNSVDGVATQKKLITDYGFALVDVSPNSLAVDFYAFDERSRSWTKRYGFEERLDG